MATPSASGLKEVEAGLQDTLTSIVALQRQHSAQNTPAMKTRGELIRHALPADIDLWAFDIAHALGEFGGDLGVEGSDGTGLKSHVPWVRIFSSTLSPKPTDGWYLVYLFHPDASGVSLCLSHGSTEPKSGSFQGRSKAEIKELMDWAAIVVDGETSADSSVRSGVNLGKQRLAAAYEKTTVISKFYPKSSIPDDTRLHLDLIHFGRILRKFYAAQNSGLSPGASGSDVAQILQLAEEMASPFKQPATGQGWGLSPAARRAVELRAMRVAENWLEREQFTFKDVSLTDSCDYRAERAGETWVVEVKGTTGGPASVLITRNEVALHQATYPKNALLIVHEIKVGSDGTSASGGKLVAICPWLLEPERLRPTCYEYRLG
tara:strand:+ start:106 stop:1236 length:1131 start_codon:yes stop_codon:yes gene_type:complete